MPVRFILKKKNNKFRSRVPILSLASRKPVRIRRSGRTGIRGVTSIHINIVVSNSHVAEISAFNPTQSRKQSLPPIFCQLKHNSSSKTIKIQFIKIQISEPKKRKRNQSISDYFPTCLSTPQPAPSSRSTGPWLFFRTPRFPSYCTFMEVVLFASASLLCLFMNIDAPLLLRFRLWSCRWSTVSHWSTVSRRRTKTPSTCGFGARRLRGSAASRG